MAAVPIGSTCTLQAVVNNITAGGGSPGTSLNSCITAALSYCYNPTYYTAPATSLAEFQGYNHISTTTTTTALVRPYYVSHTAASNATYPFAITLTKPSGLSNGDLLLIVLASDSNAVGDVPATIPTFTTIQKGSPTVSDSEYGAYYRIVDGTEAASITPTFGLSFARGGFYIHIKGNATTSPIGLISANYGTAGTAATFVGITGVATDLGICIDAFDGGDGAPFTITGAGWTKIDDFETGAASGVSAMFATLTYSGTAAVSCTSTAAVSDGHAGCQFRIKK
jgi:hypothetical protein